MDDERVAAKTYVPAYQRETWRDHADDLGMSLSEFLRTMTQAGRRGFVEERVEPHSEDADPGGDDLETLVLETVGSGHASWEDLLDAATGDVESRLDETLSRLQDEGRLRYSGRDGGYVRTDG